MFKKKDKKSDWEILKTIENQILSDELYQTIIHNKFKNIEWYDFGSKCIINDNLLSDLDILKSNDNNTVLSKIDHSTTLMGTEFTKKLLESPTDDINILRQRQSNIKKLLDNETLYLSMKEKLNNIKSVYKNILWFMNNHDVETLQFFQKLYYDNKFIQFANNNDYTLSFLSYINLFIYPFMNIIYPLSSIFLPYQYAKLKGYDVTVKIVVDIVILMMKNIFSSFRQIGILIFSIFCYIYSAYNSFMNAYKYYKIINLLRDKYVLVIDFLNTSYDILHMTDSPFYHKNIITDFEKLKDILMCKDITKSILNPSCFESNGQLLRNFNSILHNKNDIQKTFVNILQYIGYIDYLYSMTTLIKNENFSFPDYLIKTSPYINCIDLWHPCLSKEKIIYNSLKTKKNIMINGPNEGGKSTYIKTIIINIILSQTVSITNSKKLEYTSFHFLHTSINIPDIKGKESLFEAEKNRLFGYINNSNKLSKYQYGIGIFDEILTSTNIEEGICIAKSICQTFNDMTNNINIITTHFDCLPKMGFTNFENYKVVIEQNNEDIKFLYKIEPGISDQKIAINLLRKKGFSDSIINNAINYKNLKNEN